MKEQRKMVQNPLGGEAVPLMIPMVTSASLDQSEETRVELCADGGVFRRMSEVEAKAVDWVVQGVVPRGELTLLGGDGGVGKGLYLAQMIAYVTTGRTSGFFPNGSASTETVIIFTGEDRMDSVWKPRLEAAGADPEKVLAIDPGTYWAQTGEMPYLDNSTTLDRIVAARPALVIFDPIQQFLSPKANMNSRMKMREATTLLRAKAREHGFAVLLVVHTNKSASSVAGRKRLSGSTDLWDVARSVLLMGRTKNEGKVYVSHEKSSNACPAETVLFTIEEVKAGTISTAKAVFDSTTDRKDIDFVSEKLIQSTGKDGTVQEMIVSILSRAPTGQMASDELQKAVMEQAQCSKSTYDKARCGLTKTKLIRNVRVGLTGGKGYWMTALTDLKS